jgi:TPR repeat protein
LAEAGFNDGMVGLGVCLHEGRGMESDPARGCEWWERAAGEAAAGQGAGKESAARSSRAQALYELGVATYLGQGRAESEQVGPYRSPISASSNCLRITAPSSLLIL